MLASLWSRVIFAVNRSVQWAARMPRTLLAAMLMPIPVPQMRIPFSAFPEITAFASSSAMRG